MYVAPSSWKPGLLRDRMSADGEIAPVAPPDVADLDRHMWETDAPFDRSVTKNGGLEILAKGRSAVALLVWLEDLVPPLRPAP
jgi:hypothetical protein